MALMCAGSTFLIQNSRKSLSITSAIWRARQIAEVIDNDFLLFWIKNVEPAHINAIDRGAAWADGLRSRFSWWWARRNFRDVLLFLTHANQLSPGSGGKLGDPDIPFRQACIKLLENLRPEAAIVNRGDEWSGDAVQGGGLLFQSI